MLPIKVAFTKPQFLFILLRIVALKGLRVCSWKVTTPREQPQCITDGYQIFIFMPEDTLLPFYLGERTMSLMQ
ncbi:hypothetical protein BLN97_46180 [Bradyrhizobium elkanii]|nr:hypothetical protein BLN97_46180 [Bradyrhizobium elkanii]